MLKTIVAMNQLVRAVVTLALVGLGSTTAYLGYQHYYAPDPVLDAKEKEISTLQQQVADLGEERENLRSELQHMQQKLEQLALVVRLLKVDHRVAHLDVLEQWQDEETGKRLTRFRFVEVDEQGKPLHQPKVMTINGDLVYVDYLVVKFKDELIESADPIRSTSICLFRRVFGEHQQPNEGFVLDEEGTAPPAYLGNEPISPFEQEIWTNFWEYANNPKKAEEAGIRAAHGEAVSTRLSPGRRYKIVLRASDGLSITSEELPPEGGVL